MERFAEGSLTFREFVMNEPLPLATIQAAVLEFLRLREDAVLFGAQAVNALVDQPRMSQDVDILATDAKRLAEELRNWLNQRFHIAIRVRSVRQGVGYRLYQVCKPRNRHLVDFRAVGSLPPAERLDGVLVARPEVLIAYKVESSTARSRTPKGMTDMADLRRLLLAYPRLKTIEGPVAERLRADGASHEVLAAWAELVAERIEPEDEDAEFD